MLTLTDAATNQLAALIKARDEGELALRVAIAGRLGGMFQYRMGFVETEDKKDEDEVVDTGKFLVFVDDQSASDLEGATLDYVETSQQKGFKFDNPNPVWSDPTALRIQELLDKEINPGLRSHGGFCALVDVKDKTAYVAFGGGCQGCSMVDATLKDGVEVRIKDAVPEIEAVVDTTDHSRGANPYA